jgi:hypothetical protein
MDMHIHNSEEEGNFLQPLAKIVSPKVKHSVTKKNNNLFYANPVFFETHSWISNV